MSSLEDRAVHSIVFVDPQVGIDLEQAWLALDTIRSSPRCQRPLKRLVLTSSYSRKAVTSWDALIPFLNGCFERGELNIKIFSNLAGLSRETATFLLEHGVYLAGEWGAPDFTAIGLAIEAAHEGEELANAMLAGLDLAMEVGALNAIEYQINADNVGYADSFIRACTERGVEYHFEMQERPCRSDKPYSEEQRDAYRASQPTKERLLEIVEAIAEHEGLNSDQLIPPFFSLGSDAGACEYIRGGIFLRSNGRGGLRQTVCLSNWARVSDDFLGEEHPVENAVHHELVEPNWNTNPELMQGKCQSCDLWRRCLGGCRAMAYVATGSAFAPDPNCWK